MSREQDVEHCYENNSYIGHFAHLKRDLLGTDQRESYSGGQLYCPSHWHPSMGHAVSPRVVSVLSLEFFC